MPSAVLNLPDPNCSEILTPATSKDSFRALHFPSGFRATLIHSPDAVKASVSLTVGVGSMCDPPSIPGLAHAMEHSIMMGSEKFPNPTEYRNYVANHGGNSNAMTLLHTTQFFFHVSATTDKDCSADPGVSAKPPSPPIYGALDRFAAMLSKPNFDTAAIRSEINAINEEHANNLPNDTWRINQLERTLADPGHRFNHFATGNSSTLLKNHCRDVDFLRDELADFHAKYYTADNMSLAIVSRDSLDEMEEWVSDLFSDLAPGPPASDLPTPKNPLRSPYTPDQLGSIVYLRPVAPLHEIRLVFPYPDQEQYHLSKPYRYICHVLGQFGPGSLVAFLQERRYAVGVSIGYENIFPGAALLRINITATDFGIARHEEVIYSVFQYIKLMQASPIPEWAVDEICTMEGLDAQFSQPESNLETVRMLSDNMHRRVPWKYILTKPYEFICEFDPEGIRQGLAALRPDNFFVIMVGNFQSVPIDRTEPYYGAAYGVKRLSESFMQLLRGDQSTTVFRLPTKNQFIPSPDLALTGPHDVIMSTNPALLFESDNFRIWYILDTHHCVPRSTVQLCVRTPYVKSAFSMAILKVYIGLVNDHLSKTLHAAYAAGLQRNFKVTYQGIQLLFDGYTEKIGFFVRQCIRHVKSVTFTDDKFEEIRDRLLNELRYVDTASPYHRVSYYVRTLVCGQIHTQEAMAAALASLTPDRIRAFAGRIFNQCNVDMLCHGSMTRAEATNLGTDLLAVLNPETTFPYTYQLPRTDLERGQMYVIDVPNLATPDNCVNYSVFTHHCYDTDIKAKTFLLYRLSNQFIYSYLRYRNNAGYMLGSYPLIDGDDVGLGLMVQSSLPTAEIEAKMLDCLERLYSVLLGEAIPEKDDEFVSPDIFFDQTKAMVADELEVRPSSLVEESGFHWNQIVYGRFDFDENATVASRIRTLTQPEIVDFYARYVHPKTATESVRILVHVTSEVSDDETLSNGESECCTDKVVVEDDKNTVEDDKDAVEDDKGAVITSPPPPPPPPPSSSPLAPNGGVEVPSDMQAFKSKVGSVLTPGPVKPFAEFLKSRP